MTIDHVRTAHGDPPPFVRSTPPQPADNDADEDSAPVTSSDEPKAKPLGPFVVGHCERQSIGGTVHGWMHCEEQQHFARPNPPGSPKARESDPNPTPIATDDEDAVSTPRDDVQDEPERPISRLARERREARACHG